MQGCWPNWVLCANRTQIYKGLGFVLLVLIALQYLSGAIDRKSIETIFTSAASSTKIYTESSLLNTRSPSQQSRALVIYGPAVANTSSSPANKSYDQVLQDDLIYPSSTIDPPQSSTKKSLEPLLCPATPPKLVGPIAVSKTPPELPAMELAFGKVEQGGKYAPRECKSRWRVAIVVPFRDRFPHLMTLLYNLHPLLQKQQIDYQIFVVEQEGNWQFNRATLMNVGYVEALKERADFDCFIFHDVDLLPENDKNLYNCPQQPRHMSVAIDKFRYKLPYTDIFGGVSAMSTQHFRLVNGFSNVFWGWGGEDDDMSNRIKAKGLHIARYPANVARYKMLVHKKEKPNPQRYEFLNSGKKRYQTDGLSNLKYEIIDQKKPKLYTWYLVRLTPPSKPS